ncbi:MAG: complex I NDUFA9 subunit family protein [Candidatus Thiodiazotropha sp. (ex Epidulcina cf. delphinae)]|nr:complex I NDUFA9 subunit family protein [Candidatus Thiodiazotropha sp. (ex Epidulcina cf. delphinae)]
MTRVCILGGSGFVGQHLVANLSNRGIGCRILTRHPQRHANLKVCPGTELIKTPQIDTATLVRHFTDCDAVINLIGILNESGRQTFRQIHVELVDTIVEAAIKAGATRLLHMSALHADAGKGSSNYLRSKGEGENRAHTHGGSALKVTSFRPSVIFGPGDSFFNRFAALLKLSPLLFPLASPRSRFAPVYVGDVAEAFARALEDPTTAGRHYDLCGPQIYTLAELVRYTAKTLGIRRIVLPLGSGLSRLQAHLLGHLPGKPFTLDNYLSLQTDSVCERNGLLALDIQPQTIESQAPCYLSRAGYRGRYDRYRRELTMMNG